MKKLTKDLTYKDFDEYIHRRIFDGNWSAEMAIHFIECYRKKPKFKKKKWFKENLHNIFNIELNIMLDIETGNYMVLKEEQK